MEMMLTQIASALVSRSASAVVPLTALRSRKRRSYPSPSLEPKSTTRRPGGTSTTFLLLRIRFFVTSRSESTESTFRGCTMVACFQPSVGTTKTTICTASTTIIRVLRSSGMVSLVRKRTPTASRKSSSLTSRSRCGMIQIFSITLQLCSVHGCYRTTESVCIRSSSTLVNLWSPFLEHSTAVSPWAQTLAKLSTLRRMIGLRMDQTQMNGTVRLHALLCFRMIA
mmetsp:Transcript_31812/g.47278  ORF Transcript_31812/g.47278 Transcript_31812/m.47278 type:complete len:225 (-) Transcript_31812:896-1570(-)